MTLAWLALSFMTCCACSSLQTDPAAIGDCQDLLLHRQLDVAGERPPRLLMSTVALLCNLDLSSCCLVHCLGSACKCACPLITSVLSIGCGAQVGTQFEWQRDTKTGGTEGSPSVDPSNLGEAPLSR